MNIDYWPLIGILIIILGLLFKINTLLVILTSGIITGLIAKLNLFDIVSALGHSFTENRYMSLFILTFPMIGLLERYGLKEQAKSLIKKLKKMSSSKILIYYFLIRKITNGSGLHINGHPTLIRPLIAPMSEAAAANTFKKEDYFNRQKNRALSACTENIANFFSQLLFIGSGGLLLIKGVMLDNDLSVSLETMVLWSIPTAIFSFFIFFLFIIKINRKKLKLKLI